MFKVKVAKKSILNAAQGEFRTYIHEREKLSSKLIFIIGAISLSGWNKHIYMYIFHTLHESQSQDCQYSLKYDFNFFSSNSKYSSFLFWLLYKSIYM